jgi:hypothetical protein
MDMSQPMSHSHSTGDGAWRGTPIMHFFFTKGALLFLLPASLLSLLWLFPQIGYGNNHHCDPWYYFGLIANPLYTLHIPFGRQISRVPVFLPAHYLYQIADGAFVERGFYLAFTIIPLCLVYIGFARRWNSTLAAFATVVVFFSNLYISIGSTTFSLPALSLGLSAMGLYLIGSTVQTATGTFALFTLAAGAIGSAFHAHALTIFTTFAIPILACYSPLFASWGPRRFTAALCISGVLGALGSTLVFGLLNYAIVGRGISVFLPQIRQAFRQVTEGILHDTSQSDWYLNGPVIGLVVLCLAGLLQHAIRFFRGDYRDLPSFIYIAAVIVSFGYLTFIQHQFYFKHDYYYVFLLIPATLSLASLLRDLRSHVVPTVLYVTLFALMCVITYANLVLTKVFHEWAEVDFWAVPLGLAGAIVAIVVSSALSKNRLPPVCQVALLSCLLLFFGVGRSNGYGGAFFEGDRPDIRAGYDRVKLGINFIRDHYRGTFPNFWLADVPGAGDEIWLFRSFVRCESEFVYPDHLPDPEVHWQQPLAEADGAIVISNEPTISPAAQTTLAGAGITARVYQSKEISSVGVRYYVLLLDLIKLRSRQAP